MTGGLPGTPSRRRVYLLRHGDVSYYLPDGQRVDDTDAVPLTPHGRAQAQNMATVLADIPFDLAIHSGLPRTEETLGFVIQGRDTDPQTISDLREIRPANKTYANRAELEHGFIYAMERAAEPGARFGGGELFSEFYHRVAAAITTLLATPGWTRMLLVAHGGTNRAILSWAVGSGLASMSAFEQETCALTIFDVDVVADEIRRRYLRLVNFTPDNPIKAGRYLTTLETLFTEQRKA